MVNSYLKLSFDGLFEENNKAYLSASCLNALVELDQMQNTAKVLRKFPDESDFTNILHHKLYKYGRKIIFTPDYAQHIHIFDMMSGEIECVDFRKDETYNSRCIDSYIWDGRLWLFFANRKTPVCSMDLLTEEICYHPELTEPLKEASQNEEWIVLWSELWKDNGQVYGACMEGEYIVHIDLIRRQTDIISMATGKRRLSGIAVIGDAAYITEWDSYEILAYSLADGRIKKYMPKGSLNLLEKAEIHYSNILAWNDSILLVPNHGNQILCLKNDEITHFCDLPEECSDMGQDRRKTWRRFYSTEIKDESIRLFPGRSSMLVDIYPNKKKAVGRCYQLPVEWMDTDYCKDYLIPYVKESVKKEGYMTENDMVTLRDYIRALK